MSCYFNYKNKREKNNTSSNSLKIRITDEHGLTHDRKIWTINIAKLSGREKLILRPLLDKFFELHGKVYGTKKTGCAWHKTPFRKDETLCFIFQTKVESLTEARIKNAKPIVFVDYRLDPEKNIYFLDYLQDPGIRNEKQKLAHNLLRKLACGEKARQIFIRSRNRCSPKDGAKANFLQVNIK